jgi:nitrous oxide reductase accessory protein NosL
MKKFIPVILFLSISCSTPKVHLDEYVRSPASFQTCFQLLSNFFPDQAVENKKIHFLEAKSLNEIEQFYQNYSLIDIQHHLSNEDILKNNDHLVKLLSLPLKTEKDEKFATEVSLDQAEIILKEVTNSRPNKNHMCYDPKLKIGFCFGRATMAHMEALVRGVHPESIRKIWIAGDMKEWGHHVATMIKAKDGWYVIDTNLGRVVKAEEWIKFYEPMKAPKAKSIMVFVTRADRFGPYDTNSYSGINLFNSNNDIFNRDLDYYKGYFHDYFEDLDRKIDTIEKFNTPKKAI